MSHPATYNIRLTAGDDFQMTVRLMDEGAPISTVGYTFKAQARRGYFPHGALLAEFTITPVTGGATISLTDTQTRALAGESNVVWDFQSASPDIRTWVGGSVLISQEVTE